ncbi:MAG TPA: sensor histidine kinase [Candidatus Dormibacteraeota bacterium]|nr:sensor histidine kinase [Candidatus Dormibacteraeota bacterium]
MAARPQSPVASPLGELQLVLEEEVLRVENALLTIDEEVMQVLSALDQVGEHLEDSDIVRRHVLRDHARFTSAEVEAAIGRCFALRSEMTLARLRLAHCRSWAKELRYWHSLMKAAAEQLEDHRPPDGTLEEGLARYRSASRQVFQTIDEERMRIARDMHDGPAQSMSNLVLRAEILERMVDREPERAKAEVQSFKDAMKGVLDETRQLIFDLRPMTLDDLGVIPTLRRLVNEFRDAEGIEGRLSVIGTERRLPAATEGALFRIVKEALVNVRKHARPHSLDVLINLQPQRVSAVIKDDGDGFDLAAVEARLAREPHFGLISMRERADLEHGQLEILSQVGRGTEVRVTLPIEP